MKTKVRGGMIKQVGKILLFSLFAMLQVLQYTFPNAADAVHWDQLCSKFKKVLVAFLINFLLRCNPSLALI